MEVIELIERAHAHLNDGDVDALIALCDADFHLDMSERVFNPSTYRGHEGIRRFYAEVQDVWDEFRWEPERLEARGERVAALVRAHGRGRGSGLEIDRRIAFVWEVKGGRAVSLRMYVDRTKALEAVGLAEPSGGDQV